MRKPFLSKMLGAENKASSCTGKQQYSRASAEQAALKMAQKRHEPFEAYKCRHCDFWHVGHPPFWRGPAAK